MACSKHQRYSAKCPDCRDAAEAEYTDPLERQISDLLTALKECATTGNLASVGRGPVTLVGAEKRLAHIGKTAQDAIDAVSA